MTVRPQPPFERTVNGNRLKRVGTDSLRRRGIGTRDDLQRAAEESHSPRLFLRSLVGMDREAAKRAFGEFLSRKNMTANQTEFINLIIDHLTERGVIEPGSAL